MPFGRRTMRILTVAVTLALAGCITPFRPRIPLDGVEAQQIRRDTWCLVWGNDFPSATVANDFVLLQAAQTTIAHGATHFIVLSPAGNVPLSAVDPRFSDYMIAKPGEVTIIRIITIKPGKRAPSAALDANQVLRVDRARLRRA
jgi:hypothetical protein